MSDNGQSIPAIEEWTAYIRGETPQRQAEWMEALLLEDETAFSLYMQAMDMEAEGLPVMGNPEQFVQNVMNQLVTPEVNNILLEQKDNRRRWYEHRLFHYAIAACLTLIFLSAGWFDKLTPGPQQVNAHANKASYSEDLVRVTTGWLDRIKP
ncbi:hypothetical protein P4H66_26005 [Paenibacillus dokdonensis]|uniref:Transmembrane anti-sigma factor n=1 Tax=Paenibacillus dokdonensis TaxID=2567944 RepID=A0ABU6GU87_9BACL|nr:hypothetical protein [Paenibacillus dokdonensis]MEC0243273.1 hypothetical protein [Paenibacillus dokdonensis]